MTYADFTKLEEHARTLLEKNVRFRVDISPYHLGQNHFDQLVVQFDNNVNGVSGWDKPNTVTGLTLRQSVDQADRDLREARDLYAFLAVYADEARFRLDPTYHQDLRDPFNPAIPICASQERPEDLTVDPPVVDWCNFGARMRQTVREVADLRLIFGQQFTVDALGLHFSGSRLSGGDAFVRDEIRKLNMAVEQYDKAETAVAEALHIALGSGCLVSDFYTQNEWARLSRAVEGKEVAEHHIAVRKSYLDANGPTEAQHAAQGMYQSAATNQYIQMIGTAGLAALQPKCSKGVRPDSDMAAKMAANMLDTRQKARQLSEGRNIFGFDVHFTPARPFKTAPGSSDMGLWDEAQQAAQTAKAFQSDAHQADREFDQDRTQLGTAITGVKASYDTRLLQLTGCSRNISGTDEAFWQCIDASIADLEQCDVKLDEGAYAECMSHAPTTGLLRQTWDNMRTAYLRLFRAKAAVNQIPERIRIEGEENATIQGTILGTSSAERADQVLLAYAQSVGISLGASVCTCALASGVTISAGISFNPVSGVVARLRSAEIGRQAAKEVTIQNAHSEATVRNLMLEQAERGIEMEIAAQEFSASGSQFQTLVAEAVDLVVEAKRARNYLENSAINDPGMRLVRDSARLQLAAALEYASRISYMAAKRAEYEYATRLSASNFRISDIYRARTADDILDFLSRLQGVTNSLVVQDSDLYSKDFRISVAQQILGMNDDNLRRATDPRCATEGQTVECVRRVRFHDWIAQHTRRGANGKDVLAFTFTTSLVNNGIFSNVIQEGLDQMWLQEIAGVGQPRPQSTGFAVNLVTRQPAALLYRTVIVSQQGVTHLRARSGCLFDYNLMHPAALLGFEWPSGQNPTTATAIVSANVNTSGGGPTSAFLRRPISATEWQVEVRAGAPEVGLADMDLQQLDDIELSFSTTYATRQAGEPQPQDCVRVDY